MSPLEITSKLVTQASLADYTSPSLVLPRLGATDAPGIIAELSQALKENGCVPDVLPLYHAALNRELMESTAQGSGIAYPHARLSVIKRLQFAFGCAPAPVRWGSNGSSKVRLVFLLAVPATDAAECLRLLASIARLPLQPGLLDQFCAASSAPELFSLLSSVPIRP